MEVDKPTYPVVVIGCGASGIAALSKLKHGGVSAIGVEASNRIGGRINTVEFGEGVVDLGAAWCHGELYNKVFELANPHNLLGRPEPEYSTDQDWYVFSDGSLMPTKNAELVLQSIKTNVGDNNHFHKKAIPDILRQLTNTIIREPNRPIQIPITESFLEWYARDQHLGGEDDPLKAKSVNGLNEQKTCNGEFWLNWKGKGYITLLDVLMNRYPDASAPLNLDIRYNKEVTNICWTNPEIGTSVSEPMEIKFRDGTKMQASKVIVTIPLGILKCNYETLFTPPLPKEKIDAINNLQCCILDKIYIEFETAWWPEDLVNFRILWREEDKAKFDNEKWVTGIYGLRKVEYQPKVLLAWITGPLAEEMEKVTDDQVSEGINKLFEYVFSMNFKVSPVVKLIRSNWASNVYARGSYSYRAVTSELCESASAQVLSEPLMHNNIPLVCFAGEATSHEFHGNVHGAVEAGFREAERIIRSIA